MVESAVVPHVGAWSGALTGRRGRVRHGELSVTDDVNFSDCRSHAHAPFVAKWRTAMGYLESDLRSGTFPKLAAELMALGWNEPAYRDSLRRMMEEFTEMLGDAVRSALAEYDVPEIDVQAVATLIRTFQVGMMAEQLAGVDTGHAVLLAAIDGWLQRLPRRVNRYLTERTAAAGQTQPAAAADGLTSRSAPSPQRFPARLPRRCA